MRNAFAAELTRLAGEDDRVVLLSGDIGNRLFDEFKGRYPRRFFNCGVAEANMVGVAGGMALSGLRPVTYTINSFMTARCLEQIRLDICYHRSPVVIVGVGAGLCYASLGATHHSLEDIGTLRLLPHMTVVCPGDPVEVRLALRAALVHPGPVYLRLGKKGEPVVHAGATPGFQMGRGIRLRDGRDACILGTGNVLPLALEAARALEARGVSVGVVSLHTVKPLDEGLLDEAFRGLKVVATLEEHSLLGGLGGAVAEWLADRPGLPGRLVRLGTADTFLHEAGGQDHARRRLGLALEDVVDRIAEAVDGVAHPRRDPGRDR
ncbi:MAG: transketolase [Planctomycetes bacterium]|nr:transketolase [Planctomycetota bacterium]